MKKTIIILVILMGLVVPACEYGFEEEIEIGNIYDYDFENDIPEFENIKEAILWVYDNSKYISDLELYGVKEYLDLPEEFYNNRDENNKMIGDCDGFSSILAYIIETQFGIRTEIIILKIDINSKIELHALVYANNKYLDAMEKSIYKTEEELTHTILPLIEKSILYRIPYSEYLWMTMYYHNLIGEYE